MPKAIITGGLGFGDEGKGATVDFLCRQFNADLVVKYCGGPQCGHRVELPDGRAHIFSQFGAGTFQGIKTYIGQNVVFSPIALRNEAKQLQKIGVDPDGLVTVHPYCLVSTPLQMAMNCIKELTHIKHGSCGVGLGETRNYWLKYGNDAIFATDLWTNRKFVFDKLKLMRERYKLEIQPYVYRGEGIINKYLDIIFNVDLNKIVDDLRLNEEVMSHFFDIPKFETAIFEGAQGVLLDEWRGFHPYTTWSTTTFEHAFDMLVDEKKRFSDLQYTTIGITRAYHTRHGKGPFPSVNNWKFEDKCNVPNEWQDKLQFGSLDMALFKYALKLNEPQYLTINCIDHLESLYKVLICTRYDNLKEIFVSPYPNIDYQERITNELIDATPYIERLDLTELLKRMDDLCPIVIEGRGPTADHRKIVTDIKFSAFSDYIEGFN